MTLSANQIEFVNLIVNHRTEHGAMAAALFGNDFEIAPPGFEPGVF